MALRGLVRTMHEAVKGIEKDVSDFGLTKASVFVYSSDLAKLDLDQVYERLEVVPLSIFTLQLNMT